MKSLIIGGGKVGYYLLQTLQRRGYHVILIERNPTICQKIAADIDAEIICGDGTDLEVLKDAGIQEAEIIAAVTGSDEENLVICEIAKLSFDINKTIARINNPKNISMFKALGVDKTVCSTEVIANLIEYEFDKDHFKLIHTFERGSMILVEITIHRDDRWCNQYIHNIDLPAECVITSILRDETVIYPRGNTQFMENDKVLVITNNTALTKIKAHLFRGGKQNDITKK
ncbi:potassium channel family protein [Acetobacterium woodii]|uniref:Trk system potassium uptake protein TrkA n=1 Tax=Acetobacterium woodii (strain ATCC 29683 / DSM 1030 / JCM 2381 / KCTC 1655 / WB1) TaxID=931626 RepID=H6LIZ2_ACEWD|nr:TrkA family potassium uptake protein [Acetobacterium woodii]AFA47355.1 K+ uptake protein, NAD-binding subunit TrkA1 [Acetobacterium woodii DSM 1030]